MNRVVSSLLLILGLFTGGMLGQTETQPAPAKDAAALVPAVPAASTPVSASIQPAAANATAAPRRPRFVPVLVSATDASGNPVTGLAKEQFSILDTTQPAQPLQVFKAADIPLHLAVVLLCDPGTFAQQQAAAIELVKKTVRPKIDEAFVIAARGKKPWPNEHLDWRQDPAELAKTIEDLDRSAGLADAFNFDFKTAETEFNGGRASVQTYGSSGPTVFDAVYAMMNSDPRPARRVIVIFRDAWGHSQGFGERVNSVVENKLTQIIGVAQELHIATFVIGLEDPKFNGITDNTIGKTYISLHAGAEGGAGSGAQAYDKALEKSKLRAYEGGKINVQRLAAETGGEAFWSTKKNYSDAVASISNSINGQYILTFTPNDIATPTHTLKISSTGAARVLAQTTFFFAPPK